MTCKQNDEEPITVSSYIISAFTNYFGAKKKPSKKLIHGLMPHSPTRKTDAYITPQTVTAPITMPGGSHDDDDDCWYLSKSDSSSSSSGSSFSTTSGTRQRRSVSSLSEILCEHYVQKTLNNTSHNKKSSSDVPLETYKVFEASRKSSHTKLSVTDDDDDESWFIWDKLQNNTKEWIQVVDEELFLPKEKVTTDITIAAAEPNNKKTRSIRANPDHLRMIVAEVNMMRANKIVGPLKSRGFLAARVDTFVSNQSSPLRLPIL